MSLKTLSPPDDMNRSYRCRACGQETYTEAPLAAVI
jgi:hypothetical protein